MSAELFVREPCSAATHLFGAVAAAFAGAELLHATRGGTGRRFAVLAYCLTMVTAFSASALYHAASRPPGDLYRTLDHCAIYLLIVGTNTPINYVLVPGMRGRATIAGLWSMAALGIAAKFLWPGSPHQLDLSIYIALGLAGLVSCGPVSRRLKGGPIRWVFAGGALYITGGVLDAFGVPQIVPGVWGSHETFHVFVLGGAACFHVFIRRYVAGCPSPLGESTESRITRAAPVPVPLADMA